MDTTELNEYDFWNGELSIEQSTEAAKRWNAFPELINLLKEHYKMSTDETYGDLVWRLAIQEKTEKLLNNLNQQSNEQTK